MLANKIPLFGYFISILFFLSLYLYIKGYLPTTGLIDGNLSIASETTPTPTPEIIYGVKQNAIKLGPDVHRDIFVGKHLGTVRTQNVCICRAYDTVFQIEFIVQFNPPRKKRFLTLYKLAEEFARVDLGGYEGKTFNVYLFDKKFKIFSRKMLKFDFRREVELLFKAGGYFENSKYE
jgi:hypothetical protein